MRKIEMYKDIENSKNDAIRLWNIEVDGTTINTAYGIEGGKIRVTTKTIEKGKYVGKINELTAEEVAVETVAKKIDAKLADGYNFMNDEASENDYNALVDLVNAKAEAIEEAKAERLANAEAIKAEKLAEKEAAKAAKELEADEADADAELNDEEVAQ